ncbi:MAG: OmpA family protein [Myxococcales bacterium]|nr:OmpA family protein [Myxococcales bacterium]
MTRFSTGDAALSKAQLLQVQRAAKRLSADAALRATVRGHADRRGSESENTPLSEARAQMVVKALTAMGIAADRMEVDSAGSQAPLDPANSPAAYARNRRVEILFQRKEAP